MSQSALRRTWLFLPVMVGWACTSGCVSIDRFHRDWEIRTQADGDASGMTDRETEAGKSAGRLTIGMSKDEIRKMAGPLIEETDWFVWKLRNQFRPFTPGLYPYFDSREVYLHFDDKNSDKLAAINVRGIYNSYP
jgi:hypothetical protein